jgi:predicted RNA-binding protein YlxR (DUF448 family)
MVASSRTSSSASSVASISMPKSKQKSPARPHYLGGSNNLLHERQRREKAEHSLDKTKSKLNLLKQELAPKVEQLIVSIKVSTIHTPIKSYNTPCPFMIHHIIPGV